MDLLNATKALDLSDIRYTLIRMEDTIIFNLIERCQFPWNQAIYQVGGVPLPNYNGSFLQWTLHEMEKVFAKLRRYQNPDEYSFSKDLPEPILPPLHYPKLLHSNTINVNDEIYERYVNEIVPYICAGLHDKAEAVDTFGSSAVRDIDCLQVLSRRIHYGKFVAEVKYMQHQERYNELIKANDEKGLEQLITDSKVENQVLSRLEMKARTYGYDPTAETSNTAAAERVNVSVVISMYKVSMHLTDLVYLANERILSFH